MNDPNALPSDFDDVLAAIAPTPLFISAPRQDDVFEHASAAAIASAVSAHWPDGDLHFVAPDTPHAFPAAAREAAYAFLLQRLL